MPLLSELEFVSPLRYAVRATTVERQTKSKLLRDLIKRGHDPTFDRVAELISTDDSFAVVRNVMGGDTIAVPVPGSAVRRHGSLWVPERICEALQRRRLVAAVEPMVQRMVTVPKSAFAMRGQRPTAQRHYETMAATRLEEPPERVILVDDIVTSGATILAAASRVADLYPEATVLGFAVARAVSTGDFDSAREPVRGWVRKNTINPLTTRRP